MDATAWIRKPGILIFACLVFAFSGSVVLAPEEAVAQSKSGNCQFTLNIPALNVFPLHRRLRGDEDMDGNSPRINVEALIHQPQLDERGKPADKLRLDLVVRIAEFKGDGTAFEERKSFWLIDKWIGGGKTRQIQDCLANIYKECVRIFAKDARSEAQLKAQCTRASEWRIKDTFEVKSRANNRKWTTYLKKRARLLKSAKCLSDATGKDTGKLGCKDITFRPRIKIDVNFGRDALAR
ncbi:MAG: hypothetical protein IH994_09805 [Proteobacteria bacterium]|nr:hypothetical protein [Pseudomonadota bacterium]